MYIGICLHCHWISEMNMKFNRHLHIHTKTNANRIDKDFADITKWQKSTRKPNTMSSLK